jgi:hypothetical protein
MIGLTVGISRCDIRDIPTVGPRGFARYATAGRFWRIFFCAGRNMPRVAQTVVRSAKNRQWIRCRVVAKSAGPEDPVLTSMGALLYSQAERIRVIYCVTFLILLTKWA